METQHWVSEAYDCHYLDSEQAEALLAELQQVGPMLNSMMEKSHLFCRQNQNMISDEQAEYLISKEEVISNQ